MDAFNDYYVLFVEEKNINSFKCFSLILMIWFFISYKKELRLYYLALIVFKKLSWRLSVFFLFSVVGLCLGIKIILNVSLSLLKF